jgi:hypothetical protein
MKILNDLGVNTPATAPAPPAAPAPSAAPSPTPKGAPGNPAKLLKEAFPDLPDEVLQVPVVQWIAVGRPPAVRLEPGHYYPELKPVQKHLPSLMKNGFNIYKSKAQDLVFFNPVAITGEELMAADEGGKLESFVPSYGELMGKLPNEMSDEQAAQELVDAEEVQRGLAAEGFAPNTQETPGTPPSSQTPVPPAPAAVHAKLAASRSRPLGAGAPTSGPFPGAGRIPNALAVRPL